jgi:hypothetical protein
MIALSLKIDSLFEFENSRLRGSEKIGYAVNQGRGMMEYWSAGMLGLVEWDLIFIRGIALK